MNNSCNLTFLIYRDKLHINNTCKYILHKNRSKRNYNGYKKQCILFRTNRVRQHYSFNMLS